MTTLTCREVQPQLDLLAASECDPPARAVLEEHLRQCSACAASFAESQRLLGLLDLHWQEAGLRRLHQRIEEQARPARRSFRPILLRVAAVAALFVLTASLTWLTPRETEPIAVGPEVALLVRAAEPKAALPVFPGHVESKRAPPEKDSTRVLVLPLGAASSEQLQQKLAQAQQDRTLVLPPAVHLQLTLVNRGELPVKVQMGDVNTRLWLDIRDGPVVRHTVAKGAEPEFFRSRSLELAPGKEHIFQIDRLIAGTPGRLEYVYLTAPREYRLTPRLRLTLAGQPVTVQGPTMRIRVVKD